MFKVRFFLILQSRYHGRSQYAQYDNAPVGFTQICLLIIVLIKDTLCLKIYIFKYVNIQWLVILQSSKKLSLIVVV